MTEFANEASEFEQQWSEERDSESGAWMNLYPNPSSGKRINLEIGGIETDQIQLSLYDATGKQVSNVQWNVDGYLQTTWEFEQKLSSGIYLLEMRYGTNRMTSRIVIE